VSFIRSRSGYECLPETVISVAGIAEPDYKLSAACVSSQQCSYNRVLDKSRYVAVVMQHLLTTWCFLLWKHVVHLNLPNFAGPVQIICRPQTGLAHFWPDCSISSSDAMKLTGHVMNKLSGMPTLPYVVWKDMIRCACVPVKVCPMWGRGTPLSPLSIYFLIFSPFYSFFQWLYLFSFVHPFPFYQNSPTPFPGRRS